MVRAAMRCGLAIGPEKSAGKAFGPTQFADIGGGDGKGGGGKAERGLAGGKAGAGKEQRIGGAVGGFVPEGAGGGGFAALDRDHAVEKVAEQPKLDVGGSKDQGERLKDATSGGGCPEQQATKDGKADGGLADLVGRDAAGRKARGQRPGPFACCANSAGGGEASVIPSTTRSG